MKINLKDSKMLSVKKKNDILWGYLMITPLMIGLSVFYFYPFIKVFIDSFYEVGAFNKRSFIGFTNYNNMISDLIMWKSLGNTMYYTLLIVPITISVALILAAMLNGNIRGSGFFRTIYFIPTITMTVAIAMVWRWIFNGDYGILNYLVSYLGVEARYWLSEESTALVCISIVSIWMGVGYNMVILLAGMQGVSRSYYEAADLDGASKVRQFFLITLPLVTPTLFFVMITTIISTLQTFDVIYMMIPSKSIAIDYTQSIVMYFYRCAFNFSQKGYASAIAVFLFILIMCITAIQLKLQKKWVNYD